MWRRLNEEVSANSSAAMVVATNYADQRTVEIMERSQEVLEELCDVRDQMTALVAQGKTGGVSAKDYHRSFQKIQARRRQLERQADELAQGVEYVGRIEANPEGWVDTTFYEKYPQMAPEFSF